MFTLSVSEVGGGVTADFWCRRRFQLVLTVFSLVRPPDYHFQELITKVDPLLFVKLYDPEKEDMRYAGRLLLKGISEPTEILSKLGEMAGYAPYEVVHFRSLDKPKEEGFCLELYVQKLELDDPSVIRLTSQNCYSKQPELLSIKYRAVDNLVDILVHYNWVEFSHPDAELKLLEPEDGDIVCFQKSLTAESRQQFCYPDFSSFLEYVRNRQPIRLQKTEDSEMISAEVAVKLAAMLTQ